MVAAPSAGTSLTAVDTYSNERGLFGTVRGEFDITDQITGWAAVRGRKSNESSSFASPTLLNSADDTSVQASQLSRQDSVKTGEIGLRAKFNASSVGHTINASTSSYQFDSRTAYIFDTTTGSNLYNPVNWAHPASIAFAGGNLNNPFLTRSTRTASYAWADTLALAEDKLLVTLGVRQQKIGGTSSEYSPRALQPPVNSSSGATPVADVVFKASKQVSLYADYIEGLTQVAAASGFPLSVNVGQMFDLVKVKTKQKERGIKYDGGKLGGSLALFTTNQPTAFINPLTKAYGV